MAGVKVTAKVTGTGIIFNSRKAERAALSAAVVWVRPHVRYGHSRWRRAVRRDTGAFWGSIRHRSRQFQHEVLSVIYSEAPPARQRLDEHGRRAGARMPPPGVLLPWMERHGIPPEAEIGIRRAIARRGIPGTHAHQRAFALLQERIHASLPALGGAVAHALNG